MVSSIRLISLLSFLLFFLSDSLASEVRSFDLSTIQETPVNLSQYVTSFEDIDKKYKISEILSSEIQERFLSKKVSGEGLNFGYTKSNVWLKLKIENSSEKVSHNLIEFTQPLLGEIQLYLEKNGGYEKFQSGYATPLANRPYKHRFFVFPVEISPNSKTSLYFKISSENAISVPVRIWKEVHWREYERNDYVVQALYFGGIFALGFFNLFIYFVLHDKNYLIYFLFIVFAGLTFAAYTGIGPELIWKGNIFLSKSGVNIGLSITLFLFVVFTRRMLNTKNIVPVLDKISYGIMASQILLPILLIISFSTFVRSIVISHIITAFFILILGIICAIKKERSAYFFLIAFSFLLVSLLLTFFRVFDLLPMTKFSFIGPQIGSAIEILFLSFALADRFNILRKEKEKAELTIKENLEKSNIELDQKVKERTKELNQSLSIIKYDLSVSKKIQQNSIYQTPVQAKNLEIVSRYVPMSEVGGDYFDICKLFDDSVRIFIADATGHGVQGALITMAVKGIYDNIKSFLLKPSEILEIFSHEYFEKYQALNSFLTAVVVDIDVEKNTISYASAGHPKGVLLQDKSIVFLPKTGKMIGIFKDNRYENRQCRFGFSDQIYLFTDGIYEEFNHLEEEFGEDRVYSILQSQKANGVEKATMELFSQLDLFLNGRPKHDDIAFLGIEYKK